MNDIGQFCLGAMLDKSHTENFKKILVSGIFSGKIDSVMLLGFEYTINPQNLIKIVEAIFEKIEMFNFFLCEPPLILTVSIKWKNRNGDICKGTLDIEFERHWSDGLGATLGNGHKENYFFSLVSGIFAGNPIISYCWGLNVP